MDKNAVGLVQGVEFRLPAEQKARFAAAAKAGGLSLGEFMRQAGEAYALALGGHVEADGLVDRVDQLFAMFDQVLAENTEIKARQECFERVLELPLARAERSALVGQQPAKAPSDGGKGGQEQGGFYKAAADDGDQA